jgi:hypothetical protein
MGIDTNEIGSQKGKLVSEIDIGSHRLNITISLNDTEITFGCTFAQHGVGNIFIYVVCLSEHETKFSCVE